MNSVNDKERFSNAIGALAESFSVEATQPLLRGYWLGLSDLSIGQVEIAVALCIRECKSMPRPVEIREKVEGTQDDAGELAWAIVLRSIGLGPYKHVDFADGHINAAIRQLGGWPAFLSRFSDGESEKWARIEFLKSYKNLRHARVSGDVCKPLPGLSETQYVAGIGVRECVPIRIGNGSETNRRIHGSGSDEQRRAIGSSVQASGAGA